MAEINKERKIILIGGIILLLMGAVYRFYPNFESMFSSKDEIILKQKKLVRYRKMVQEKKKLQAGLMAINQTLTRAESSLLTGGTPALAAVDIQNLLNDIAGRSQAEIKTMRVLKPEIPESSEYIIIPVQVTLDSSIRQLKEIFYRIENSQKLLKISSARIRLPNTRHLESIQSTFTVEGFMKNNQKSE